jgi:hypothetical protein
MQNLLSEKSASILLIERRLETNIVVAAPHHTPGGNKTMPCPEHTDGDENTGIIAWMLAETLKVSSIIACNYPIDPNKSLETDYARQIQQWKPKYLIEIHGHGAKGGPKPDDNTIEVSSGTKTRETTAIDFAKILKEQLQFYSELENFNVKGEWDQIFFKATGSATIKYERWIPIHIELPPSLRLSIDNTLPEFITKFVDCLAGTIKQVCK